MNTKRDIAIDITEANIDFVPLTKNIDQNGTLDFRVRRLYSHLGINYNRVATGSDTFLVRSELVDDILTMKIL